MQSTVSQPNKEASDLRLALGINREGPEGEEGGGESRDMAEAEQQLSGSPLEGLALQTSGALGAAVLSGAAATFCCGGEEVGSKEVLQKDTPEQQQQQPGLKQKRAGEDFDFVQHPNLCTNL